MKFRIVLLFIFGIMYSAQSYGQIEYIPASAHRFSIGVGGGVTVLYGDFKNHVPMPAVCGSIGYNISPYVSINGEGQGGYFKTGGLDNNTKGGPYIRSLFLSGDVNIKFAIVRLLGFEGHSNFTNIVDGIYVGIGGGLTENFQRKYSEILPIKTHLVNGYAHADLTPIMPIDLGINFDLPKFFRFYAAQFNFNVQYTPAFGDNLDYYKPKPPTNTNDSYLFVSGGLIFNFGHISRLH